MRVISGLGVTDAEVSIEATTYLDEHRFVDLAEVVTLAHDVTEGGLHLLDGLAQRDVV